jgi:hypothetical protein
VVKRTIFHLLILLLPGLAGGCALFESYPERVAEVYSPYSSGQWSEASRRADELAGNGDGGTGILFRLEQGMAARCSGDYAKSLVAFGDATNRMQANEDAAIIRLSSGLSLASSWFTNRNALPYQGRSGDRILAHTYMAENYLCLGQLDKAKVELRRAYEAQIRALEIHQRQAAKAEAEAQKNASLVSGARKSFTQQFPDYRDDPATAAKADFVNPLTVLLDGIVFGNAPQAGAADLERAIKDWERMEAFLGKKPVLAEEIALVRQRQAGGGARVPRVYVIYEDGLAPQLEERKFALPIPVERELYVVTFAWPVIGHGVPLHQCLEVAGDNGIRTATFRVTDTHALLKVQMRSEMTAIFAGMVLEAAAKATAQYALQRELGGWGALLGAVYSIAMTRADLRSWVTLPNEYQFAALPAPASGRLGIGFPGCQIRTLAVAPDKTTIIFVKCVNPSGSPLIQATQF